MLLCNLESIIGMSMAFASYTSVVFDWGGNEVTYFYEYHFINNISYCYFWLPSLRFFTKNSLLVYIRNTRTFYTSQRKINIEYNRRKFIRIKGSLIAHERFLLGKLYIYWNEVLSYIQVYVYRTLVRFDVLILIYSV